MLPVVKLAATFLKSNCCIATKKINKYKPSFKDILDTNIIKIENIANAMVCLLDFITFHIALNP